MLPSPPLFSLRFLDPPPSSDSHLLSPKVLSATYDHDAKLRRLAFLQKCFQKRDLWAEVAVLERLYYKNKNQHKQAGYWWRFCEVRRLLSRLKETNLAGMASDLMRGFYGGRPLKKVKGPLETFPSQEALLYAMNRLVGAVLIIDKAQNTFAQTYCAFHVLLAQTQFMPLALLVMSVVSRLAMLSRVWADECDECFELLKEWRGAWPNASTFSSYDQDLPSSMADARRAFALHCNLANGSPSAMTVPMELDLPPVMPELESIVATARAIAGAAGLEVEIDVEMEDLGEPIDPITMGSIPSITIDEPGNADRSMANDAVTQGENAGALEKGDSSSVVTANPVMSEVEDDAPSSPTLSMVVLTKKKKKNNKLAKDVAVVVPAPPIEPSTKTDAKTSRPAPAPSAPAQSNPIPSLPTPVLVDTGKKKRTKETSLLPPLSSLLPPEIVGMQEPAMKKARREVEVEGAEEGVSDKGSGVGDGAEVGKLKNEKLKAKAKTKAKAKAKAKAGEKGNADEIDDIFGGI